VFSETGNLRIGFFEPTKAWRRGVMVCLDVGGDGCGKYKGKKGWEFSSEFTFGTPTKSQRVPLKNRIQKSDQTIDISQDSQPNGNLLWLKIQSIYL
jgi:hypothetical protein